MKTLVDWIGNINGKIGALVFGTPMIILILGTGIYFSFRLKFFQIFKCRHIFKNTLCTLFNKKQKKSDNKSISQFQALSTALAATIGTGSIAGVATAITIGGAGAIFWMWMSAIFGMMTVFAENVLGIYYRRKNVKGDYVGGPMYYIETGLKSKWLAVLFCIFCVGASFGMGNMAQANSISDALNTSYGVNFKITGIITALLVGLVIVGGIKRIGKVAEMVIPLISVVFVMFCLVILLFNIKNIPTVFKNIFSSAFGLSATCGGISGVLVKQAVSIGVKRGVFSNEAGLGSSVMAHSTADVKEPVVQGMWGVVEVFIDTMVVCTLTALVILSTGVDSTTSCNGSALVIKAFEKNLGCVGGNFVTISIIIYAFATLVGWSYFGEKAFEYLFKDKSVIIYKTMFIIFIYIGSITELNLVWEISDTLNGLMAIPNLIALWLLSSQVILITQNYLDRKKGKLKLQSVIYYDENTKSKARK